MSVITTVEVIVMSKPKLRGLPIDIYMMLMVTCCVFRNLRLHGGGSLHLHIAQKKPPFHTSLQHPGTETRACDPITKETKEDKH